MATITTRFSLGDTVFTVAQRRSETPVACTACGSTGKVTLASVEYTCPACGGGKIRGPVATVVVSGAVIRLRVTDCERACRVQYFVNGSWFEDAELYETEAAARASMGG